MGTGKKLLLASFVSMMMVLAFLIGLVPSHDTESTGAAGSSAGRIDMVDLLDKVLGYGVKQGEGVTLESRLDGVVIKTPVDNAVPPEIPVPLQAAVDGAGSELVTFVANEAEDAGAFPEPNTWVGDVFSDPVSSPFLGALDIGFFLTGIANTTTAVSVYALTNAVEATKATTLVYETANEPADALGMTLVEMPATVDNDKNGIPDDVFNQIGPGEIWISNVWIDGVLRTVMIANVDPGTPAKALGDIYVSPNGNVTVQSPTLQDFIDAGLIPAGENGLLIVEVVDDLAALLDEVDGDGSQGARQGWADAVNGVAPGPLTSMAQYVEISLVYTLYSGTPDATYEEIEDLRDTSLSLSLTMTGLEPGAAPPKLWSYSTMVADNVGSLMLTNDPAATSWNLVPDVEIIGGDLNATLQTLSVFAPLDAGLSLTGAAPSVLPQGYAMEVALSGVIPTMTALDVAQAAAAYAIYFNDEAATFRLGPAKQEAAITAFDGVNENTAYVISPPLANLGDVDVKIVDLNNPANQATAPALLVVVGTADVTTEVQGSATAGITLDPPNGDGLPAARYLLGSAVAASLVYDDTVETFNGWTLCTEGCVDAGADVPLNFTVDGPTTLIANFSLIPIGVALGLYTAPPGGGTLTAAPLPDLPGDLYTPGTAVVLTADPAPGYAFSGWTNDNAGELTGQSVDPETGVATANLLMNGHKKITANFTAAVTWALDLGASPADGGTAAALTPPNAGAEYLDGTVVTVRATPASAAWNFVRWTGANAGDLANANAAETTLVMNSDKSLTANFRQVLTITSITPNNAWIFGGVVARITGTGLTNATVITIDGVQTPAFRAAANGTSVEVVVPVYTGDDDAAVNIVNVVADDDLNPPTAALPFTYKRHQNVGGVNTTAFILEDPGVENTVQVTLDGTPNTTSPLVLPALDTDADLVFGIARNSLVGLETKCNTGPLGVGMINALAEAGTVPAGDAIAGAYDFSLHLYATEAAKNTPPVGSGVYGAATNSAGAALLTLARTEDDQGNPLPGSPALWTFPLDASGITYGDVRNGLTMWGVGTAFDYVTEETTVLVPETVLYQSEIQVNEVDPPITGDTTPPNANQPNTIVEARLYSLNGFSLRSGALLTEYMQDTVRLATASGTANGDMDGGTPVRIICALPNDGSAPLELGGLAWVDRIEFQTTAKAIAATATAANFVTVPGTNEYILDITTPPSTQSGIMDMVIYLKADNTVPAVTLERAFEYTKEGFPIDSLLLILLGLLIALLGLLAGGDSGGGGGGPCFIATAAYGTPMAADIDTLRAVRDTYLLDSAIGTAFVDTYYQISPMIADVVATHPMLAALVRVLLVPVIFLGKVALMTPTLAAFIGLSLGAAYMLRRRARSRA